MTWLDQVRAAFAGPLTPQDREAWAEARTLEDLGELTAQWLEGRIDSQPSYYGTCDVDEDLAPGLTDTLAALNRAGFLTNNSQAGSDEYGQQAAVIGFATPETAQRLAGALDGAEYRHAELPVRRPFQRAQVDRFAQFSWHASGREITETYRGLNQQALDALRAAVQVSIFDPVIGRNTLWAALDEAANQSEPEDTTMTSDDDRGYHDANHLRRLADRCDAGANELQRVADDPAGVLAERGYRDYADTLEWGARKAAAATAAREYAAHLRTMADDPSYRAPAEQFAEAEKVATAAECDGILIDGSRLTESAIEHRWHDEAGKQALRDHQAAEDAAIEGSGLFGHVAEDGQVPFWQLGGAKTTDEAEVSNSRRAEDNAAADDADGW